MGTLPMGNPMTRPATTANQYNPRHATGRKLSHQPAGFGLPQKIRAQRATHKRKRRAATLATQAEAHDYACAIQAKARNQPTAALAEAHD